jgi:hypothetical protein
VLLVAVLIGLLTFFFHLSFEQLKLRSSCNDQNVNELEEVIFKRRLGD